MNHEHEGILQEGRLFEIGEETGIKPGECSQGARLKKSQSRKFPFVCQHCGKRAFGRKDGANRFCQQSCQAAFDVARWFKCSCCHALIGIGAKTSAKILGLSGSSVTRQWQAKGIVSQRPKSGSVVNDGRAMLTKRLHKENEWKSVFARYWMEEVRNHGDASIYPDWRFIAKKEKARKYALEFYRSIPQEIRIEKAKKAHEARKIKEKENPEFLANRIAQLYKWRDNNPHLIKAAQSKYMKNRKAIDPGFKVMGNLRNRFKDIMASCKRGKGDGFSCLTGCSTKQLAKHLESRFKRGMTWGNYGTHWHVDHILPCATFDHTNEMQRKQCWHWTNLRPLEAKKNMDKSDTITHPQMQLLLCASH